METSPDYRDYETLLSAFSQRQAELAPGNRAALFAALAAVGIHTAVVTFDGCGDSGQIEAVTGFAADNTEISLPDEHVEFRETAFADTTISMSVKTVREIIEDMVYDLLEETHAGWEDGDGAYGEFTFSVPDQTITLAYNERFIDSTYHEHQF
jgi:hypothetical protein